MNFLLQLRLWFFKRFFKKNVGHPLNDNQAEMFRLAESGVSNLNFPRSSGASTFLIIYAHWKQASGYKVVVVGSRYVRTLAETYLKGRRRFPIILHNSSYAASLKPQVLLIDQSKDLSASFKLKVVDKLIQNTETQVVSIDTQ